MNRSIVKLGEHSFVTKLAGFEHSKYFQHNATHEVDEIPLIQGKNIKEGRVVYSFDWYITKAISDALPRSVLNKKCIVIPYVGSRLGELAIFENDFRCHLASNVAKVELTDEIIDLKYLYYYLKSSFGQSQLFKDKQGSAQPNITMEAIRETKVVVFDVPTQQKIASVLSALDSKIELNNRINAELEAMAKTLYDYWFVQFDFPFDFAQGKASEQGKPYKSSGGKTVYNAELKREIPEGWEVKTLAKVTAVNNESVNPMLTPEKEFKHYSIPTYDSTKTYGIEKGIDIRSNKFVVAKSDILVSKLNPWFSRVIYPIKEDDLICSTEFVVWRTSNINIKNYLFMVARGEHFISHCSQSATGTSNSHKRVNPTVMMRYKVPFNSELIQKFGATINSWIKIGINKQIENKQLIELRDWLLPMLMNGQVTVKEAEESLSMAAEPSVEYKKG